MYLSSYLDRNLGQGFTPDTRIINDDLFAYILMEFNPELSVVRKKGIWQLLFRGKHAHAVPKHVYTHDDQMTGEMIDNIGLFETAKRLFKYRQDFPSYERLLDRLSITGEKRKKLFTDLKVY